MVVFMIMASQFKSLRLPFIMLFTIPVSLVGIVIALLAAGQGFSITALMGILMVIGIAVSNGILLVDDAARRLDEGATPRRVDRRRGALALRAHRDDAAWRRSSASIPTALGLEHGTEANQPLALAVVGGLTSSTLLSLFLVPTILSLARSKEAYMRSTLYAVSLLALSSGCYMKPGVVQNPRPSVEGVAISLVGEDCEDHRAAKGDPVTRDLGVKLRVDNPTAERLRIAETQIA